MNIIKKFTIKCLKLLPLWFNNKSPSSTFYSLDIFRGLASLCILIHHSLLNYIIISSQFYKSLDKFVYNSANAVLIFFVISGYCICASAERHHNRALDFIKKRIIRIYPPYFLSILFGIIVVSIILVSGLSKSARVPNIKDLLITLPLLFTARLGYFNSVYWSLVHEVHFYIIVFISLLIFNKKFHLFLDALTVFFIFVLSLNINQNNFLDQLLLIRNSWFNFYIGVLIYRIIRDYRKYLIFYHLIWLFIIYYNFKYTIYTYIFFILLLTIRLFDPYIKNIKFLNPLFWLGTISYSLYLTHIMVGPRIIGLLGRIFQISNLQLILIFIFIALPLSLFVAYIFYLFAEKPFISRKNYIELSIKNSAV